MKHKVAVIGGVLILAELALILISWILSASMTRGVRSLLSDEGIRWLFGSFADIVASPLLAWLMLLLIALGCFQKSGLFQALSHHTHFRPLIPLNYRDRLALRVTLIFLVIYISVILLLTMLPHAVLLSATGSLYPSAFSHSLVPIISFGIVILSVSFGLMSGRLQTIADILSSLTFGIEKAPWLFVLYILLVQLVESFRFVLG